MTDRQAKQMWLEGEGAVSALLLHIQEGLQEAGRHFLFEPVCDYTMQAMRQAVEAEIKKLGPHMRVEVDSIVQDSITLRFVRD